MKVRILYPTALINRLKKEPAAGDVVDLPDEMAKGLIEEGFAEKTSSKVVEQATAAPGEKRRTRRKKS